MAAKKKKRGGLKEAKNDTYTHPLGGKKEKNKQVGVFVTGRVLSRWLFYHAVEADGTCRVDSDPRPRLIISPNYLGSGGSSSSNTVALDTG